MSFNFFRGLIATVVVALMVGYGVSRSMNNSNAELSNLAFANVEALADGEGDFYIGIGVSIPIDDFSIRSNRCVCKSGHCSNGAWVSFRRACGTGDSDSDCGEYSCNR